MNPPFFFHIHLPKTAGSTFNEILLRNFGPNLSRDYGLLNDYTYTREQTARALRHHPNLRAAASHRYSADLPWDYDRLDVRAVSFVRHPGRRLLSLYFYNRHLELSTFEPDSRALPVDEFFQVRLAALEQGGGNAQARQLALGFEEIERLAAEDRLFLLPSERFNEALLVLARLFPGQFGNLRYERQKISRRDQPVPEALVEEYARRSTLDSALHALAGRNLDRLIRTLFPGPHEMETALRAFAT